MKRIKLFGSSTKVKKGEKLGYRTQISYLAAGSKAICPFATDGCRSTCLAYHSGHFQAPKGAARKAQAERTKLVRTLNKADLIQAYVSDLVKPRDGWNKLAVRINGSSDLTDLAVDVAKAAKAKGINANFYDYTKDYGAMIDFCTSLDYPVHLTFSLSESNWLQAREIIKLGGNVAVPVASLEVAEKLVPFFGASGLINGDDTDLRFLDPTFDGRTGRIVFLTPKGTKILKDTTGFLVTEEKLETEKTNYYNYLQDVA